MKNKGGRPLKFKSVAELETKINAYFEDKDTFPHTVSGLAYWLGCDRKTLINYEEKERFFPTIKKAKTRIEAEIEQKALTGYYNPTFSIFNLKNNFDWKDKQEDTSIKGNIKVEIVDDLPEEE